MGSHLIDIEQRLQSATGPDRELDLEIAKKLFGFSLWKSKHGHWNITWPDSWPYRDAHASITVSGRDPSLVYDPTTGEKLPPEKEPTDWADLIDCPHYTTSLDAAVALVERMGFFYRLQKETPVGQKAFLAKYWATVGPAGAQEAANAETGPVALMLALIRALIAKV